MQIRVRNYEVDWQGIVHNGNYLLYCEVGRVEYLKHIGAAVDLNSVNNESKVVLVRNEIDYRAPARFDELLNVYTRTAFIHDSSFMMEGILEDARTGRLIAENKAFHVWLDPASGRGKRVPENFRGLIRSFEGPNCEILASSPAV
ncbi:MAG TPA: thioesterase family protein [Bacteroidota bacterium]|nr:thioesterase family protein [Bacteroidota bacterium]